MNSPHSSNTLSLWEVGRFCLPWTCVWQPRPTDPAGQTVRSSRLWAACAAWQTSNPALFHTAGQIREPVRNTQWQKRPITTFVRLPSRIAPRRFLCKHRWLIAGCQNGKPDGRISPRSAAVRCLPRQQKLPEEKKKDTGKWKKRLTKGSECC